MMRRMIPAAMAMAALGGCNLAPRYNRPPPAIPASWPAGDAYLRQSEATLPAVTYQDIFRDPHLQAIIAQALTNNQDLRAALANVASARAQARVARGEIFPQIDGTARHNITHSGALSSNATPGGGGQTSRTYSVQAGLSSFEVDLFGRLRNLSDAAFDQYLGTEAALRGARLTLVSQIATSYLTLAADRSLLAIATDTEKSAIRSVELTTARLKGGIAPRTDLRQAETIRDQAQADKAQLIAQIAQDRNALELLVGAPVADADLPPSLDAVANQLGELPAGLDSQILLRRPDVVQAEYTLRAANARIGAARAAFFPTISLTSFVGLASSALSDLFTGGAFNWQVAPQATLPIFDAGVNKGNLQYAKAQRDLALAQYQKAIQSAFADVADALARRGTIGDQIAADSDQVAATSDTLTLTTARYQHGIDSYLDLLDAQRTLYQARQSLIGTQLTRALNLVSLYSALGGDQLVETMDAPKR
jgi:multidrug efflux system outer membrane protein